MRRTWRSLVLASVMAVGALAAACESTEPVSNALPTAPQALLGLTSSTSGSYTFIKDPLLPGITSSVSTSSLIGLNGGSLTLLGHTLTVPAGAVTQPTLFLLTVLPTGYVEVQLTATVTSLLGGVLDVGGKGFAKPVAVSLTYSRATNVSDPSRLKIVRLKGLLGYTVDQAMPSTVNTTAKTVTAQLEHFTRYVLATD